MCQFNLKALVQPFFTKLLRSIFQKGVKLTDIGSKYRFSLGKIRYSGNKSEE